MKTSLLFIFIFICCSSSAQTRKFELVENVYREWHQYGFNKNNECDFFLFKDSIDNFIIDRVKNIFSKATIFYGVRFADEKLSRDSVIFDSQEKQYILNQLENLNNNKWPDKLFKNSRKIFPFQIDSMYVSLQNLNIDPYIKLCYNVYTFSRPILLRNNTLCLFYSEERSFAAREGEFWIYKRKGGVWKRYSPIYLLQK